MSGLDTWVIVGPKGLAYVGLHINEHDAWEIYLGWPDQDEITARKAQGWYAAKATITWTKPRARARAATPATKTRWIASSGAGRASSELGRCRQNGGLNNEARLLPHRRRAVSVRVRRPLHCEAERARRATPVCAEHERLRAWRAFHRLLPRLRDRWRARAIPQRDQDSTAMPQRTAQARRESSGAEIMTLRDRLQRLLFDHRTDPIYNRCMICGQSGHCSASCPKGRVSTIRALKEK